MKPLGPGPILVLSGSGVDRRAAARIAMTAAMLGVPPVHVELRPPAPTVRPLTRDDHARLAAARAKRERRAARRLGAGRRE